MLSSGREIRMARLLRGWRREDLAAAAGVHPGTVAVWERRSIIPDPVPMAVAKIAGALGEEAIARGVDLARPVSIAQAAGIMRCRPALRGRAHHGLRAPAASTRRR
jgi:transcriptional regulator with XRE-family HTH domain